MNQEDFKSNDWNDSLRGRLTERISHVPWVSIDSWYKYWLRTTIVNKISTAPHDFAVFSSYLSSWFLSILSPSEDNLVWVALPSEIHQLLVGHFLFLGILFSKGTAIYTSFLRSPRIRSPQVTSGPPWIPKGSLDLYHHYVLLLLSECQFFLPQRREIPVNSKSVFKLCAPPLCPQLPDF